MTQEKLHVTGTTFPQGFQKSKKFADWTYRSGGQKIIKRSDKYQYQENLLRKAKFAQKLFFFVLRFYTLY